MDISKAKEDISISYLSALCAYNKIAFDIIRHDENSTDALIMEHISLSDEIQFEAQLRVQLKCTSSPSQYRDYGENIHYTLKAKNYNDLCSRSTTPIILALLILPENKDEWVKWTPQELLIKGQMYWEKFSNNQRCENKNSITIEISKKNILNIENLPNVIKKIAMEEYI